MSQVRDLEQMLQESEDAEMKQTVQDERHSSLQLVRYLKNIAAETAEHHHLKRIMLYCTSNEHIEAYMADHCG